MNARSLAWLAAALLMAAGAIVTAVGPTARGAPTRTAIELVGRWDARIDANVRAWRGEAALELARAFDLIGGGFVLVPVGVTALLAFAGLGRFGACFGLVATWCVTLPLGSALKHAFERERPRGALPTVDGFAFPSVHALAFTALCVAFAIGCAHGRARGPLLALAIAAGAAMGASRVVLSVHWASDALAGVLLGAGAALACALAGEALETRFERSRERASGSAGALAARARPGD